MALVLSCGGRTVEIPAAREHLTTAATMYREMEMPFWLEKAKGGRRGVGVM